MNAFFYFGLLCIVLGIQLYGIQAQFPTDGPPIENDSQKMRPANVYSNLTATSFVFMMYMEYRQIIRRECAGSGPFNDIVFVYTFT